MSVHPIHSKKLKISLRERVESVLFMIFQIWKIIFTNFLLIFPSRIFPKNAALNLPPLCFGALSSHPENERPAMRAMPPPDVPRPGGVIGPGCLDGPTPIRPRPLLSQRLRHSCFPGWGPAMSASTHTPGPVKRPYPAKS